MSGPLIKIWTNNDSNLTNPQGAYLEYHTHGSLHIKGRYSQNLKSTEWYQYKDNGKHIFTEVYENGVLIKNHQPDTIKKDTTTYKDDREADLKGGTKAWINYIVKNM